MRPWTERVYGIPPEQVVGSSGKLKLEIRDGKPVLTRLPEIDFIDDGPGKPVGIQKFIGRRPIAAFAIPTVTIRCFSGRLQVKARVSCFWFTTPMRSANGL